MNVSSLVGLILALVVFLITALTSVKNPVVFLDWHAALIVLGGTFAATLLSFSGKNMLKLTKIFLTKILRGTQQQYVELIHEIIDLAKGYRENESYLAQTAEKIKNPFLREAVELVSEGGLTNHEIDLILTKRAKTTNKRYEEDAHMFTTLAKFPPAFGLLGAVVGMVSLMQNLGGADAIKGVGPAMAVALVATLYGIAIANFIFIPLGENLSKFNRQDKTMRTMVIDGMRMVRAKKHPLLVEENLKSYILPSEREIFEQSKDSGEGAASEEEAA